MIHIQQDPRAIRSAGLIADGLTACLARMPFGEVTVTSVCRAAGVGRATFYRLFDNTADVLDYRCGQVFTAMPDAPEEPPALLFALFPTAARSRAGGCPLPERHVDRLPVCLPVRMAQRRRAGEPGGAV